MLLHRNEDRENVSVSKSSHAKHYRSVININEEYSRIVRLGYYLLRKNDAIRCVAHHLSADLVIDVIVLGSNIATIRKSKKREFNRYSKRLFSFRRKITDKFELPGVVP